LSGLIPRPFRRALRGGVQAGNSGTPFNGSRGHDFGEGHKGGAQAYRAAGVVIRMVCGSHQT
jgi:hypothetical protein